MNLANGAVPKSGGTLTGTLSAPKISVDAQNKQRTTIISTNDAGESVIANYFNALVLKSGSASYSNKDLAFQADTMATDVYVVRNDKYGNINDFNNIPNNRTFFGYGSSTDVLNRSGVSGPGISFAGYSDYALQLQAAYYDSNIMMFRCRNGDAKSWGVWREIRHSGNTTFDASGFLKRASPIIEIYPSGEFTTNEESEGAEVTKESTGIYHISNVCGYNTDMGWGVHGGISVPKDNNNLELIFVDDRVQSDGSIIIETFHRQHAHLPTRFQNWRLKCIDANNERVFYKDGEPCDIPEHCRLDVRVQMPEDSVWNVKQREMQDHHQKELEQ
ncbi:putative tail fiber protein [Photorhabdus temperata subsp. temperata M1021]|nr:putative tail fiber protein [Photorhabdus temperata subsp. temperata M1021]